MSDTGSSPELRLRRVWAGQGSVMLRGALSAAAGVYRGVLAAREACYVTGLLSTRRLPVPVVSVGNLTLGGSGKTPLASLVATLLAELGARPAVVSRGYGRRTRGVLVVADREGVRLGARDAGDEPRLLAEELPGIPVVVGESRYEAGRVAVERCGADALVLDDGFQHRTLAKDLEIVVVGGTHPWGNGRLFPRGVLREPLTAVKRADVVVVTNPARPGASTDIGRSLQRRGSRATVLTGSYRPLSLRGGDDAPAERPAALSGRRVVALAGLASPAGFVATLRSLGATVDDVVEFPDHHFYTADDVAMIVSRARQAGADWIVTTDKDWVRLRDVPGVGAGFQVLSVRLDMGLDRAALVGLLANTLRGRAARGARS